MIGNACADFITKHAALHNHGHDVIVPPPTPDGNPFSHMYWVAAKDAATTAYPTSTKLALLQNIKDKLKQHMTAQHRLGDANTNSLRLTLPGRVLPVVDEHVEHRQHQNQQHLSGQTLK